MGRLNVSFTPNVRAPEGERAALRGVILAGTLRRAISEEPEQVLLLYDTLQKVVQEARKDLDGERDLTDCVYCHHAHKPLWKADRDVPYADCHDCPDGRCTMPHTTTDDLRADRIARDAEVARRTKEVED